jgi:predicted Rossmann-fold nucleotide-binding protein
MLRCVAVIGSSQANEEEYEIAYQVGEAVLKIPYRDRPPSL